MSDYEHKENCRHWTSACICRRPHEQTWMWNDDRSQVEVADDHGHVILETDSGCYGPRGAEIPLIVQAPAMARLLIEVLNRVNDPLADKIQQVLHDAGVIDVQKFTMIL